VSGAYEQIVGALVAETHDALRAALASLHDASRVIDDTIVVRIADACNTPLGVAVVVSDLLADLSVTLRALDEAAPPGATDALIDALIDAVGSARPPA
jgi:hypothetical protein